MTEGKLPASIATDPSQAEWAASFVDAVVRLREGEFIELRPVAPDKRRVWKGQRWFLSGRELVQGARCLVGCYHVFFGVCPRKRQMGKEKDVSRLTSLWADVDAKHFGDDKGRALNAIDAFPIPPSALVDSGHGYHPYWLIEDPLAIRGDDEIAKGRSILHGIQQAIFSLLDRKYSLETPLRLPGTLNLKDDPPPPVRIVSLHPDRRYRLAEFEPYQSAVGRQSSRVEVPKSRGVRAEPPEWQRVDAETGLQKAQQAGLSRTMYAAIMEPEQYAAQYASPSELHCAVCYALAGCGLDDPEILAIMTRFPIGDHPKIRYRREEYLLRTIASARRYLEEHPYNPTKGKGKGPTPWNPAYPDPIIQDAYPLGLTTRPLRGLLRGPVTRRAKLARRYKVAQAYHICVTALTVGRGQREELLAATAREGIGERTTDAALKAAQRLGRISTDRQGRRLIYLLEPQYAQLLNLENTWLRGRDGRKVRSQTKVGGDDHMKV